ncbi:cytochrome B561 [Caballeronia terrestris]|uniref:Cytochrome B561 n=2 Tax=Caballeronia TaxID=1827195 RepID=A0A158L3U7_9BURK|nr:MULTISPECIES: cytochrome b/b6 domain-containing protein [Caballeronia]SAL63323.1 cytochrome B561 [Caballeronia humi]SAL88064.1 cytochrome B561 [Caballeronia terrestris]
MSDSHGSRSDKDTPKLTRILVWDAPVRVFHWLMVVSFVIAYATGDSERWRLVHVTFGYTMTGLVAFRIVWGILGTRYSRFSSFVRSPTAVCTYLSGVIRGRHERIVGHNPAGGIAIVALLILAIAVSATGWSAYNNATPDSMEDLHGIAANLMLAVVVIHVLGVILGSFLHRENLVLSMITGNKTGRPEEGIQSSWRILGVVLLSLTIAFWWVQWQSAPVNGGAGQKPSVQQNHDDAD